MKINYNIELEKIIKEIEKNKTKPKLLLHTCCAPCSSSVIERLCNYFNIIIFYYTKKIFERNKKRHKV